MNWRFNQKRKAKEGLHPLINNAKNKLATTDEKKAELLNEFLSQSSSLSLHSSWEDGQMDGTGIAKSIVREDGLWPSEEH